MIREHECSRFVMLSLYIRSLTQFVKDHTQSTKHKPQSGLQTMHRVQLQILTRQAVPFASQSRFGPHQSKP